MSPTCTDDTEDDEFSCECFNDDPDVSENCPREVCVFSTTGGGVTEGFCDDIPQGGPGGPGDIPNDGDQPVECPLNGPDICTGGNVCVDGTALSPDGTVVCEPMLGSGGTEFGCCKSM